MLVDFANVIEMFTTLNTLKKNSPVYFIVHNYPYAYLEFLLYVSCTWYFGTTLIMRHMS